MAVMNGLGARAVLLFGVCAVCASFWTAPTALAERILAEEKSAGVAKARLLFLPEDLERLDAPVPDGERRVVVTGTYTSGDAKRPEGFTIRSGDATRPYPQGWDGLLIVDREGKASIHDVSRVAYGGRVYDLRDRTSRRAFVAMAEARKLSVVQSHLLIRNSRLDLKRVERAKAARRRVLFQRADGRIGIYDSKPEVQTLYEAAVAVLDTAQPAMAINLDMGTYDFCEIKTEAETERCGALQRPHVKERLTNLLELSIPASN